VATTAPWDNTPIIEEILSLRLKLANLLGYPNWAEYKFTTKVTSQCRIDIFLGGADVFCCISGKYVLRGSTDMYAISG